VIGVIVAEFISSSEGLGFLILKSAALLQTDMILAAIAVLCIVGLVCYGAVHAGEIAVRRWRRRMNAAVASARLRLIAPTSGCAAAWCCSAAGSLLARSGAVSARLLPAPGKVWDTSAALDECAAGSGAADLLGSHRRHLLAAALLGIAAGHRRLALAHCRCRRSIRPWFSSSSSPRWRWRRCSCIWFGTGFTPSGLSPSSSPSFLC
jgi:ABC-type nitrate/sulfonate/bicarbonate transport system permease component